MKSFSFTYAVIIVVSNLFYTGAYGQKNNISLLGELQNFYVIENLPQYRSNTTVEQTSTYDLSGGNNDGFNGTYSFVRHNLDSSLVMLDIKGPGVVNRIATPTPNADTLDIYIDDTTRPALSICYMDLFSGKVFPFLAPLCDHAAGGYYCYFPILFQQHCKIVSRGKNLQFHQLQYRLFTDGTKVQSFNTSLNAQENQALSEIHTLWTKTPKLAGDFIRDKGLQQTEKTVLFEPGESKTIFTATTGGRISGIELSPSSAFEKITNNIHLRIWWDNESEPAVDCPVSDFFGYGFGEPSMRSLLLGSENGHDYCYIPMPFDKSARVELVNDSNGTVSISTHVYYTSGKRNPKAEGKFYTHYVRHIVPQYEKHVFLDIQGKGHYIGSILRGQGLKPGLPEFFEGDDSTATDGVFRIHGTGTEDYFNGGWYDVAGRWDTARSMPLSGCLEYSRILSRTGGYRFYLSDKMSFEKSIYQAIEHGPTIEGLPAEYTSISFYYCDRPVTQQKR
jgi:Protein of unknown function (DUF2961)